MPNRGPRNTNRTDIFNRAEDNIFALLFQAALELIVSIKMVFDRLFAASREKYDFRSPDAISSLIKCSLAGRALTGRSCLRIAFVAGNIRLPSPRHWNNCFSYGTSHILFSLDCKVRTSSKCATTYSTKIQSQAEESSGIAFVR